MVIRTNGGKLTVDAKDDTVAHYGMAKEVEIKTVATSSYHEFGNVQFAEIAGGNFVIEAEANVTALHFDATAGKFENAEQQKISVDMSKATNIPSFSRDSVNIDETNGTLVAKVRTSEEDYIWLTKAGIIEQVTLSDSATEAKTTYAQKSDANYDIADQIANNAIRGENGRPLKADGETEMTEQEVAALTSASEITIQNPTKETVAEIATQGHLSVEKDTCVAVLDKTVMRTNQNNNGNEDSANTERIKKVLANCNSFEDIVDKINAGEFEAGFVHSRGVKSDKDLHGLLISGDIKLTKDLYINPAHALSFRFVIDGNSLGEDKTMTIDLNGHKIIQLCGGQAGGSSGYCLFTVRNDAIINIIDSSFGEAGSIIGNHCVFDIYEGCQINLYRGTLTLNDTIAAYDYATGNNYTGYGSAVVTLDNISSINIYGGTVRNRTNVKVDPEHLSALGPNLVNNDYVSSSESQYGTWYTFDTSWKTVNSHAIFKFSTSTTINNIGGTIEGPAE